MKKWYILGVNLAIVLLFAAWTYAPVSPKETNEEIEWLSIEEALKRNKKEPRKIFIDVYTDWCGWCKKMDKNTFQHPQISKELAKNYYAVKFNAEQKENIEFAGQTFKFVAQGKRGYHEFAIALTNNKLSYPTVVFLDEKLQMIQPIPGYQEAKNFHPILEYFASNQYKTTAWQDFMKSYKSPIN
jgi:thioredoxin-related protein